MMKILVVDDEIEIVRLLARYLESKSYDVYTATDGMEALKKVRAIRPQAVLLDLIMPGMGGIEVLKEIKNVDPEIAVIVLSAVIDEKIIGTALESGADDYITKPFDLGCIETTVRARIHDDLK